ncbi:MAG: MFS transporter [Anaerolineae bacterium]|nr:MFS transporter [Anaerolineae bacterium]
MGSRYRWFVVFVFFLFVLLHQADKLLIGPLTTPIMEEFGINEVQMGAVSTGAIIVAGILYPVWGYLYDRFARAKLLALASFIWGSTTWLSALAPRYGIFLVTRASTGIDDSSYPGLYSLLSDYFGPKMRGKVYGLLELGMPMGYMLGLILATALGPTLGWRRVFFVTGSVGLVVAALIFFFVREAPRGRAEPELAGLEQIGTYRFDLGQLRAALRKRSLLLLFVQGFFGVFPWNVLTYWFFRYLEAERNYTSGQAATTMMVAILALSSGYFIGGALGDFLFRRTPRGRVLVAATGVVLGAIFLVVTLSVPMENQGLFMVLMAVTAVFMPFAAPNVVSTVHDVTPPEVRSTAQATLNFMETVGSATAPLLAGLIAVQSSLHNAILIICTVAWLLCALFFVGVAYLVPRDIASLRALMAERAEAEQRRAAEVPAG